MTHAITTNTPPPGMLRQVKKLAEFIKPACPNPQISYRVQENTDEWLRSNLKDLQIHFQTLLTTLLPTGFPFEGGALDVAAKWARTRYRHRLRPTTLPQAHTLLTTAAPVLSSPPPRPPIPLITPRPLLHSSRTQPLHPQPRNPVSRVPLTTAPNNQLPPALRSRPPPPPPSAPRPPQKVPLLPNPPRRSPPPGLPPRVPRVRSRLANTLTLPAGARPLLGSYITTGGRQTPTPTPPPPPPNPLVSPPQSTTHPPAWVGSPLIGDPNPDYILSIEDFPPLVPTTPNNMPTSPVFPLLPTLNIPAGKTIHVEAQVLNTATHSLRSPLSSQRSPTASPELASPAPTHTYINTHNLSHIVTLASPSIELDISPPPTHSVPPPPHLDSTKQRPQSQKRTGSGTAERPNEVAKHNKMMMGQSKGNCPKMQSHSEATSNNIKSLPRPVQSASTPSQRTLQLELHDALNSATLSPRTITPERRRPSVPTGTQPRPNKMTFKINRHDPTGHKVRDWTICSTKPVVIIGDSNLSRIPPHTHIDIQIDSYPGAKFQHITQILDKNPPNTHTKIVVLSLGINHRENLFESVTGSLQALHRKTLEKYPQATIYVPIINFSKHLAAPHQTLLTKLNAFITTKYNTLFEIHHSEFYTAHDDIHWTTNTASHILQHWLSQLNFGRGLSPNRDTPAPRNLTF